MTDRTYYWLKESIYRGRFRPGQRIVERDLARRMGVSRIPLRETLRRLESEGLVRSVPNTATFIEDFSPADILEIYSMRQLLEPQAALLAAQRADADLIERLKRLCDQMTHDTQSGNIAQLDRTDYQFHHAIVVGSGHKRLLRAYESAHIRIIGPRVEFAHLQAMPADTTAREHLSIVQCLESHDAESARRIAHEHVRRSADVVEKLLREQEQSPESSTQKESQ
ncbi:MAG: GntR family transcriptional regulator [Phycisphaerales bacterium]|jgi:DNA-binding GntR family transcriptional regulator|nr:GntR family transcriptional regulator [Phycisphaerales bacterium]